MLQDLSKIVSRKHLRQLAAGRVPGQVIIQVTDACNARCPQCEMRVDNRFLRSHLEDKQIRRTLDAAARRGVTAVSFTGGEPFLKFDLLVDWLSYANELGIPFLRTGTNGYFLRHFRKEGFSDKVDDMASRLAATGVRNVWFSIDSADPAVHEEMRGLPGVFEGMAKALPTFEKHGLWPTANLGINRNLGGEPLRMAPDPGEAEQEAFYHRCLEGLQSFFRQVLDMGFTVVNFCYPMSVEGEPERGLEAVYRASSADDVVHFRPDEKAILFLALSAAVAEFRSRIRIFSPRSMLYSLVQQYRTGESHGYSCRGGLDFFFVSALDGGTYPCGFRSEENMGKFWDLDSRPPKEEESCTRCDWECFRDPSNLAGPLLELRSEPFQLFKRFRRDRTWARLWREDLRYYRASEFFDGRKGPDFEALAPFHTPDRWMGTYREALRAAS